jgi:FkbM family methyltransferase
VTAVLARRIIWKNPIAALSLPPVSRWHRAAYAPSARLRHELVKIAQRPFFKAAYRLGLGGSGELAVRTGASERKAPFRGRNLQYSALYHAQHAAGYEPQTWALFDALVGPDAVFYDVGANWGYFALALAAREGFRGRVEAFEPMPETFADLEGLVGALGLSERIGVHRFALSDHDGEGIAVVPDGLHSGVASVRSAGTGTPIALRAMDGLKLTPPSVIKLDVEGHEDAVLAGARNTLTSARPFIVFESWYGAADAEKAFAPFEALYAADYEFYEPVWAAPGKGGFIPAPGLKPAEGKEIVLALVPFDVERRPLMGEQLNVFAAPKSRRDELGRVFSARTS